MRAVGLININTKEWEAGRHLWKWSIPPPGNVKVVQKPGANQILHTFTTNSDQKRSSPYILEHTDPDLREEWSEYTR